MHRARLAEPSCNRHLTERNRLRRYRLHRQKITQMKSNVDNKAPPRRRHLSQNTNGKRREAARQRKIERGNAQLLAKMSHILTHSTLDNRLDRTRGQKSLFRRKRLQELREITDANQVLLSRLRNVKSTYNRSKWKSEHRQNKKLVSNISIYGTDRNSPKRRVWSAKSRPVTAPAPRRTFPPLTRTVDVRRSLFYTDSRSFGESVWEINVWDATGGAHIRDADHILRISAQNTTTNQTCSALLTFDDVKRLCRDRPLILKALRREGAIRKTIATVLGGVSSLLTMQLGLFVVSVVSIARRKSGKGYRVVIPSSDDEGA